MRKTYCLMAMAILLGACSGTSAEEKAILKEAYELQVKTIDLIGELEEIIDSQPENQRDSLEEIVAEMEENLFEIPGYHLELPGHEGHDHGHARLELTTEEILSVQKEMHQQAETLLNTLTK